MCNYTKVFQKQRHLVFYHSTSNVTLYHGEATYYYRMSQITLNVDHMICGRILVVDAHIFFNMRCRINLQNEAAKKGLERLEKQMKVLLQL